MCSSKLPCALYESVHTYTQHAARQANSITAYNRTTTRVYNNRARGKAETRGKKEPKPATRTSVWCVLSHINFALVIPFIFALFTLAWWLVALSSLCTLSTRPLFPCLFLSLFLFLLLSQSHTFPTALSHVNSGCWYLLQCVYELANTLCEVKGAILSGSFIKWNLWARGKWKLSLLAASPILVESVTLCLIFILPLPFFPCLCRCIIHHFTLAHYFILSSFIGSCNFKVYNELTYSPQELILNETSARWPHYTAIERIKYQ